MISEIPMGGNAINHNFVIDGRAPVTTGDEPELYNRSVAGDYFQVLGIPILQGRGLTSDDRANAPLVGVINQAMVRQYFPNENPLGKRIRWARNPTVQWIEIVGVVGNVKHFGLDLPEEPALYSPYTQINPWKRWMTFAVRTQSDPAAMGPAVKQQIWKADSQLPITKVKTMDEVAGVADETATLASSAMAKNSMVTGLRPPHEIVPLVRVWARRALDLDPSLPDAHALLALVAAQFDHDWTEADRRMAIAIARDPVPPMANIYYAVYLMMLGRPLEAVARVKRLVEDDPLDIWYRNYLALALYAAGRDEDAIAETHHVLELNENFPPALGFLCGYHASRGELAEALRFGQTSYALAPEPGTAGMLAGVMACTGDKARAEELLQKLGPPETYGVPRAFANYYLIQGEPEKAADWWEKMIDQRDNTVAVAPHVPLGRALLSSPRWPALAKRMNLPEK
jgi:hypothetical protein